MRKTKSETICNEIGEKFFSKDFVYENLKYFNEKNNKVELCDGLFEFGEFYFALQIKERSSEKGFALDALRYKFYRRSHRRKDEGKPCSCLGVARNLRRGQNAGRNVRTY